MIAVGCDHGGYELKVAVLKHLDEKGVQYKDFGTYSSESVDYPVYAEKVAEAVTCGGYELGLLFCGTGIGISIAANKVKGVRAACCSDSFSVEMTRLHNNSNILCLGGRVVSVEKGIELVDLFLSTPFSGDERHQRRIDLVTALEEKNK
ncbi:MAG: ribose 5-phosphate isomerase B [Clostridia bacterium]|nr:ribose 5-phosphate isomerase B [Clostridia bacterium]